MDSFRPIASDRLQTLRDAWERFSAEPGDRVAIAQFVRELHTVKGEAAAFGCPPLAKLAHALESVLHPIIRAGQAPDDEAVRVLDRGLDLAAAVLFDELGELSARVEAFASSPHEYAPVELASPDARAEQRPASTTRVEFAEFEGLFELARELAARSRSTSDASRTLSRTLDAPAGTVRADSAGRNLFAVAARLRRDTRDLLRLATEFEVRARELCTVPLGQLFARCEMVADKLARELSREVRVVTSGASIRVDRAVIQWMEQPLVHLMRNAIDHGVEPPATRESRGKPRAGTIDLRADARAHRLRITVSDDGAGVDVTAVRRHLIAQGVMSARQVAALPDEEVVRALFSPSLSTRTEVTESSGRGIGLDVVAHAVTGLGGTVDLTSRPGAGSTVTMTVPVGVVLLPVVVFWVGQRVLAVDADAVDGGIPSSLGDTRLTPGERDALPLVDLAYRLDQTASAAADALVVRSGDTRALLTGTEAHVRCYALLDDTSRPPDHSPLIAGRVWTPDGMAAALVDVEAAVEAAIAASGGRAAQRQRRPAVLIVDDSAITRKLLVRLLLSRGIATVIEAADGQAGLRALADADALDLVITDAKMPEVDGFALVRALRADPRMAAVPVLVLSADDDDGIRAAAHAAGADACMSKDSLRHGALSTEIARLLARGADRDPETGSTEGGDDGDR